MTNTFAARAASGKMTLNETGKVTNKNTSSSTLKVETADAVWELAFYGDEAVQEAVKLLLGKKVTCNYREK